MSTKEKEKNSVARSSVFVAILLTTFKFIVGITTGSLGILSEALHSGLDLVSAIITWVSVRISDKPADDDHHFGHGKIENFSAFIQTILLLITCVWIIYEAINRLVSGETHIDVNVWSYVVVIVSIIIDYTRSKALKRVAKKYNSQALEADALHFSTDIWSSCVVLLGLICASFGIFIADCIAALCVAVIIIYVCWNLGKKSINVLLDKVPEEYKLIESILISCEYNYSHLRVRSSGANIFVEVTIHVDPELKVGESHTVTVILEEKIKEIVPSCDTHIHIESI